MFIRLGWILIAAILLTACDRVVLTKPELTLSQSPTLEARPPLHLVVMDDQAAERGGNYAEQLGKSIRDAYPRAVALAAEPVAGQATVILRFRQLGAFFTNNRGSVLQAAGGISAPRGTSSGWESVMAELGGYRSRVSGNQFLILPGNWSGIAYVEVEVRDQRPGRAAVFGFSLASERATANTLGYLGAQMVASDAWGEVEKPLTAFLNAAVRKLANESTGVSAAVHR